METRIDSAPVDYRRLFVSLPGSYLILLPNTPTFTVVEASDAYLEAARTGRGAILGRGLFEALPGSPAAPNADAAARLRDSLEQVIRDRAPHRLPPREDGAGGAVQREGGPEEPRWSVLNSPVLDADGRVEIILHYVEKAGRGEEQADREPPSSEEYREEAETLETINRLGQVIAAELDLQKLVQAVTDVATELAGAQFGSFFYNVIDQKGESYQLYTLSGAPREAFERFPMPRNTAVFGPTFEGKGVVRIDDVHKDPRYGKNPPYYGMPEGHLPVVSYLAVPVVSRSGEVLGGLFFGHGEPGRFTARHERIVSAIAAQAAIGIDNAPLYEAVREREDRLRLATESAAIGTWDYDPRTGSLRWDDRCRAIFGLPPGAPATYDTFLQGLHPDDRARADEAVQRSLDPHGSGEYDIEYRVIGLSDGQERWAAARGRTIFTGGDGARTAIRFVGTILDITHQRRFEAERRELERALVKSEARYRSIVENALEGIWVVDAEWRTTFVNPRMAEMLGYAPEEMRGRLVTDFMGEEERRNFAQRRAERAQGLGGRFESCLLRRDGVEVWVTASAAALPDEQGAFSGAVAMMNDVTERKRLESLQARLAAIVESSEDAIVSKDLNGIVTSWNAAAERMYGWKAEDIIGKSKGLVIPPDRPDELPNILRRIRAGQRIEHYETRRIRKDGTYFDAAISVSPVKDSTGTITGAATIVRDITERKRTERELLRKQQEVVALNERLQRAIRETHHRVKNNLQIISAMIDLHAGDYASGATVPIKELKRLATYIRTLAIVHDLLTHAVREDEQEQRVSSRLVIVQLIELLRETSGARNIESRADEVDLLSKQAVTVSLIINELVSNAVKHAEGTVEVVFEVRGGMGELRVCDNGPGFPKEFDPYTHANTGLELVMSTVGTDLQGEAFFENRLQGGACVRITFPLPQDSAEAGKP